LILHIIYDKKSSLIGSFLFAWKIPESLGFYHNLITVCVKNSGKPGLQISMINLRLCHWAISACLTQRYTE